MNHHGDIPSPSPPNGGITVRTFGSGTISLPPDLPAPPKNWAIRGRRSARALPLSPAPPPPNSGLGRSNVISFRAQDWTVRHPAPSLSFSLESLLDYIRKRLGQSLYIAELSRAAGMSERSIHILFRKELGVSPMRYIKRERLLLAKRMLQDTNVRCSSVKVAAISAGFRDLGRFSIEYHSMFGEVPSQTLRRCQPSRRGGADASLNLVPPAHAGSPAVS